MDALDAFLDQCCSEIERRAVVQASTTPVLAEGARAFRRALPLASRLEAAPGSQPVVQELYALEASPLLAALLPAIDAFPWVQYPPLGDQGNEVALGRINHVRDFGPVTCGLMLIGAGCTFPLHSHPPQELYLPIADGGTWQVGGSTDFRAYGSDELPFNNPHDVHSVKAGSAASLSMFVLWP